MNQLMHPPCVCKDPAPGGSRGSGQAGTITSSSPVRGQSGLRPWGTENFSGTLVASRPGTPLTSGHGMAACKTLSGDFPPNRPTRLQPRPPRRTATAMPIPCPRKQPPRTQSRGNNAAKHPLPLAVQPHIMARQRGISSNFNSPDGRALFFPSSCPARYENTQIC